jgi:hypothetical protein
MRVSLAALITTGTDTNDRAAVRIDLFVGPMCWDEKREVKYLVKILARDRWESQNGLTSPKIENGPRKDNPDVATHKKPKKPVMIFDLRYTARTR